MKMFVPQRGFKVDTHALYSHTGNDTCPQITVTHSPVHTHAHAHPRKLFHAELISVL